MKVSAPAFWFIDDVREHFPLGMIGTTFSVMISHSTANCYPWCDREPMLVHPGLRYRQV